MTEAPKPTAGEKCAEDTAFFLEVLKEGRSLIVVRTESAELATTACAVLDRLGLGLRGETPGQNGNGHAHRGRRYRARYKRQNYGGRRERDASRDCSRFGKKGQRAIVLNLGEVNYVDSSGLGELVKAHTTMRNQGGQLKLANLNKRVDDLLQMTHLCAVFDIQKDEASAIRSFEGSSRAVA